MTVSSLQPSLIQSFISRHESILGLDSVRRSKPFTDNTATELPHSLIFHIIDMLLTHSTSADQPCIITTVTTKDDDNIREDILIEYMNMLMDPYDDIKYFTYKACARIINNAALNRDLMIYLLLHASLPPQAEALSNLQLLYPSTSNQNLKHSKSYQEEFSELWLSILFTPSVNLSSRLLHAILYDMPDKILPFFVRPIRLVDFFVHAYDEDNNGSDLSKDKSNILTRRLLALHGLFYLMRHYNLDYPNFYSKLYGLISYELLHQACKKKIFFLYDLFLSSSHLPLYLVAAFVKRFARVMLFAPPSSILWTLAFIYEQLKRYPELRKMTIGAKMEGDTFDMNQIDDLELTNALGSSLWEIETLLNNHYNPKVSYLTKRLFYQDEHWNKIHGDFDMWKSSLSYAQMIRSTLNSMDITRSAALNVKSK